MHNTKMIAQDIHWVGGQDRRIERFENLFPVPNGVNYNCYLILDEKTALMDSIDASATEQLLENVSELLNGRTLDYLVISHMEPDHCASIVQLCQVYPELKLVGNKKSFQFMEQFYEVDLKSHYQEVKDSDTLCLGQHTLRFVYAPLVHWPEVMFSYEESKGILFSADAFGSFGALNGNIFADEIPFEKQYLNEARRYYSNIVGKFGVQVQSAIKKLAGNEISMICSLHGPIWRKNIDFILGKYDSWSRYIPEENGVVIAYGSMYGNTENCAHVLATMLANRGVNDIRMYDVSKTHPSYIISDIFQFSNLVLAAPTYNSGLYLPMETLLHDMSALNIQNRKCAIIGNGTWGPRSGELMKKYLEGIKNTELIADPFVIKSSLQNDQREELEALADAIVESMK